MECHDNLSISQQLIVDSRCWMRFFIFTRQDCLLVWQYPFVNCYLSLRKYVVPEVAWLTKTKTKHTHCIYIYIHITIIMVSNVSILNNKYIYIYASSYTNFQSSYKRLTYSVPSLEMEGKVGSQNKFSTQEITNYKVHPTPIATEKNIFNHNQAPYQCLS